MELWWGLGEATEVGWDLRGDKGGATCGAPPSRSTEERRGRLGALAVLGG